MKLINGSIAGLTLGVLMIAGGAQAQQLTESFDAVAFPPAGWIVRNQSTAIGSNPNCWNRFTGATPWAPQAGAGHTGANFNCTTGDNTISGWLITSQLTQLHNGNILTFFTRAATGSFPDRLQVLLCVDGAPDSCGAAGSSGATSTDVGQFTTVLLDINPTLAVGGYPVAFTLQTATISGLPPGFSSGRIAFRYFVTNGGPLGANSNILSIDTVNLDNTLPVELMEFSIR